MDNMRSILLMTFAMVCFAIQDLFIKWITVSVPNGQVIFLLGFLGALVFAIFAKRQGEVLFPPLRDNGLLYMRTVLEGFCAIFIITALSKVALSTFATVFQAVPLTVTIVAALFLRERVGWRRWTAIAVGFVGVVMIIRPGTSGFDPATLWVLASVLTISIRDIFSRRLPQSLSTGVVSFQGFGALVVAGPVLALVLGQPVVAMSVTDTVYILILTALGVVGYHAMVLATRIGEAASLAPVRYTRMVFAIALGILFLGERPDGMTYLGAGLIIATGVYTFLRERRLTMAKA